MYAPLADVTKTPPANGTHLAVPPHAITRSIVQCKPWSVGWSPDSTWYAFGMEKNGQKCKCHNCLSSVQVIS